MSINRIQINLLLKLAQGNIILKQRNLFKKIIYKLNLFNLR